MSAHWTTDSCTLFTIVVYYRHEEELRHLNYTMVSELSHTKDAVIAFNKVLLDDLKEQLPFPVRHVHYWSDGAGSQFKNRSTIAAAVNTSYSPDVVFNEYCIIPSSTPSEIDPHDATSSSIQQQSGNDDVSPIEEAPEKSNQAIELLVGQWYAAYFERYHYWYIGIASQVNEADGKVELSFLEQGQFGKNIFSYVK
ncbi:hypothetical protein BSL78_30110 [Apostichopus japonicus]|uniref:Uncharacterized protein n=1 Tax=Stichopus japonicus TaxID=307972 RepID=A0A2G8JBF5_STIJA|nr:hypothetical protein BSL78_30110 [Apostichopus japonicus]